MISGCKLEKAISQYGERVGKKLVFKAMPKREHQRVTTRRPQRKQKKKNNNNKTGAVYKPVITNVELQSTLSLRSMAVLSSRAQERRSREIRARSARTSGKVASAPISSRFLCPRPPLLLSAPNQNRHATQAKVPWSWFSSFSLTGLSRERFGSLSRFRSLRTFEENEKRRTKFL